MQRWHLDCGHSTGSLIMYHNGKMIGESVWGLIRAKVHLSLLMTRSLETLDISIACLSPKKKLQLQSSSLIRVIFLCSQFSSHNLSTYQLSPQLFAPHFPSLLVIKIVTDLTFEFVGIQFEIHLKHCLACHYQFLHLPSSNPFQPLFQWAA